MTESEHFALINELLAALWLTYTGAYCLGMATSIGRNSATGLYPPREIVEQFARCKTVADGALLYARLQGARV